MHLKRIVYQMQIDTRKQIRSHIYIYLDTLIRWFEMQIKPLFTYTPKGSDEANKFNYREDSLLLQESTRMMRPHPMACFLYIFHISRMCVYIYEWSFEWYQIKTHTVGFFFVQSTEIHRATSNSRKTDLDIFAVCPFMTTSESFPFTPLLSPPLPPSSQTHVIICVNKYINVQASTLSDVPICVSDGVCVCHWMWWDMVGKCNQIYM